MRLVDYDWVYEMTEGVLVAAGSSGIAQAPSAQSTRNSIGMFFSKAQAAGTPITLKDSQENVVVTIAPKRQVQSVVISAPALKKDATY